MEHWINKYIGIPYLLGGQNREEGLDCWGLFRLIQKEQFGRDIPAVDLEKFNNFVVSSLLVNHPERSSWVQTDKKKSGDAALMQHMRSPTHVGVVVADCDLLGILHNTESVGCIFTHWDALKFSQWKVEGVYCHVK